MAAHRTHPIDTGLTNTGFVIVALLFSIQPAALAIHSLQFNWHSLLKPSNVNVLWEPSLALRDLPLSTQCDAAATTENSNPKKPLAKTT